jgi:hypothetical protein
LRFGCRARHYRFTARHRAKPRPWRMHDKIARGRSPAVVLHAAGKRGVDVAARRHCRHYYARRLAVSAAIAAAFSQSLPVRILYRASILLRSLRQRLSVLLLLGSLVRLLSSRPRLLRLERLVALSSVMDAASFEQPMKDLRPAADGSKFSGRCGPLAAWPRCAIFWQRGVLLRRGCSSMVEQKPSKHF